MNLENKVAIVTGAAHGIGRAIALRLAKEGADVVVADIDLEHANEVVHEIEALGRRGIATKTDVSKSKDAKLMAKTALDKFGKIDILINNAGGSARERGSLFCETTEEVWDYVIGINLKGALNCSRAVINHMIERRSGKIVSTASGAGVTGAAGLVDYSAAKASIIGFTRALAKEVASYGINVNCICPGPTQTQVEGRVPSERIEKFKQMTGWGRRNTPDDPAAIVAFLVSDDAHVMTGQYISCGGLTDLGGP